MKEQEKKAEDISSYAGNTSAHLLRIFAAISLIASIVVGIWYLDNFEDRFLGVMIVFSGSLVTVVLYVLAAICDNLMFIRYYLAKKDI